MQCGFVLKCISPASRSERARSASSGIDIHVGVSEGVHERLCCAYFDSTHLQFDLLLAHLRNGGVTESVGCVWCDW